MNFKEEEKKFMNLALEKAKEGFEDGCFPVGAVLVINGEVIGTSNNSMNKNADWASHAEARLLRDFSKKIRDSSLYQDKKIVLYTTLEPCLMCLGTALLHRVNKIVYACPDPMGGATKVEPKKLSEWYEEKWPEIKGGLFKEKSYALLMPFIEKQDRPGWRKLEKYLKDMRKNWD